MIAVNFFDVTTQYMIIGTGLLGIGAGVLGVFGTLREQSLLGDAISHAAFPGIVLSFLVTHSKHSAILMIGGCMAGACGALSVMLITRYSTLKKDAALGIVLSVFFGLGIALLSYVQKKPIAAQAVLNKFIYGNAAAIMPQDLYLIASVTVMILVFVYLFFKPLSLISFDPGYAHTIGYSVMLWDILLTMLHVITIVVGLQTVGVVLMSSLLIAPAAAARQWVNQLSSMIMLSAFFGSLSTIIGSIISCGVSRLPTGPVIVLVMTGMVVVSVVFAPRRGVFWRWKLS